MKQAKRSRPFCWPTVKLTLENRSTVRVRKLVLDRSMRPCTDPAAALGTNGTELPIASEVPNSAFRSQRSDNISYRKPALLEALARALAPKLTSAT
jgi:hypothetical protein